ncbi:MAG TPA: NAD(P)-binding domain-containing protein [Ramlibacter sp.]|nr:NAD(P)-binding domain-containing protein [Ramlibacter sp.]
MEHPKCDVTVLGLGRMGSALAGAFLAAGKTVAVWNRSPEKSGALAVLGARRARSIGEAVRASPVLVICVSDYTATMDMLGREGVADMLDGRLIVQLSSGTSGEARMLAAWATARGAVYLDGAISAWPSQIGTPGASILVAGPQGAFDSAAPLLRWLAGGLAHAGPDIGHAKALFSAALAYFAGHWIGFSHGAAVCEAEGIDAGRFGEMMAALSPVFAEDMRHMGQVIATRSFGDPESTIASVGADIARLVDVSREIGIGTAFPGFAAATFQQAVDAGYGALEHCAVVEVLQKPGSGQGEHR